MKRIPGLDGLRGLSIILVMIGHVAGTKYAYSTSSIRFAGDLGNLGVRVFFVLSGFLITSLLLKEVDKTGTVSLKSFYLRRTMRIFPAFYAFLIVLAFACGLGLLNISAPDFVHSATYTMNYHHQRDWNVGHLWSLSVEEQFYLLWPATLLLLGKNRAMKGALAVVISAPLLRLMLGQWSASHVGLIAESFPTISDTIATGCLLAAYRKSILEHRWYRSVVGSNWFALLPMFVFLVNIKTGGRLRFLLLDTAINIAIGLCVLRAASGQPGVVSSVLNWRPLATVGVMSYSLYLWQQPFLNRNSAGVAQSFPLNVFLAFSAAAISYNLIETPMLRLRERIEKAMYAAPKVAAVAASGSSTVRLETAE